MASAVPSANKLGCNGLLRGGSVQSCCLKAPVCEGAVAQLPCQFAGEMQGGTRTTSAGQPCPSLCQAVPGGLSLEESFSFCTSGSHRQVWTMLEQAQVPSAQALPPASRRPQE